MFWAPMFWDQRATRKSRNSYHFASWSAVTGRCVRLEHREALEKAIGVLDSLSIPYMMFGGNAQNVWGNPRFTKDADLVCILDDARFGTLLQSLAGAGFDVELPLHLERLVRGRIVKLPFGAISVDFVVGETDFDRSALARSQSVEYLGVHLKVVSPEDLILYKLIAHRAQDLADIEVVVRRQRSVLDRAYLVLWAGWLAQETGLDRIVTTLDTVLSRFGVG